MAVSTSSEMARSSLTSLVCGPGIDLIAEGGNTLHIDQILL